MRKLFVICDDNKTEAEYARKTLIQFHKSIKSEIEVLDYEDGSKLVADCEEKIITPYIVFMDIELNRENGIDTAKRINELLPDCYIVYLSNYLQYATDIYETNHIYFVVKSELDKRLPDIYKKISMLDRERKKIIRIPLKKNQFAAIKQNDIVYIERKGRITYIHTGTDILETHIPLSELEDIIYEHNFARCHNSYLVAMKHIKNYTRDVIVMENNINIPVSRRYQHIMKDKFVRWVKEQVL